MPPSLYLIPVTLGATPIENVLPEYNRIIIHKIRHFIVEEVRTARRFLKQIDKDTDIDTLTFYSMGKHADKALFSSYLDPLRNGESVGVISEAGCPAVADPGSDIVAIAQREQLNVVPLVGPSSILLAVMGSGFNGQNFAFNGYLPLDSPARLKRIKQLESRSAAESQTQLFIETPYRNAKMTADILSVCHPTTRLCIAAGLTTPQQFLHTKTVREWKKASLPDLSKIPAIFAIYA